MNKIKYFFAFLLIGVAYASPTVQEDCSHDKEIAVMKKDEVVSKSDKSVEKVVNVEQPPALTKDAISPGTMDENLEPSENRYFGPGFIGYGGWGPGFGGFGGFGPGYGYGYGRGFGRHGWRRHGWGGYW